MKTIYVNTKAELTREASVFAKFRHKTYRTRTTCECVHPTNQRGAILVINRNYEHTITIIRCKACVNNRKEVQHGNI